MEPIAFIHTDFPTKFGLPRQSGLVKELTGRIVFQPKYRVAEAFRGLEEFSHIWLIWQFSENQREEWSPTVRPPRLGGNQRIGVFATRSSFRPNHLGLSCVQLVKIEHSGEEGPVLIVSGIDLMDGTPIYDVKPYIPFADAHPYASTGFVGTTKWHEVPVVFPEDMLNRLPKEKRDAAIAFLGQDPRPAYIPDSGRIYGVEYAGFDIRFQVKDKTLTVVEVVEIK